MSLSVSALLLAAGVGFRLRPLTDTLPKCLAPINGEPLLGLWLSMLQRAGIDDMLVNTHYLAAQVEAFLRQVPCPVRMVYEPQLLGTAGTLLANYKSLRNDTIMLVHADNLSRFDVGAFVEAHRTRPAHTAFTMMTFDTDVPSQCGIVELDGDNVVMKFHEKVAYPPGTRANAAVYLLDRGSIQNLERERGPLTDFSTEVLPHYMGRIFTWHNATYHRDIGTPDNLRKAQEEWHNIPATQ
jgi:mannose-1-phosphate guanylyltransferase